MILIGQTLNSAVPATKDLLERMDRSAVLDLMKAQEERGAAFLDLNTAQCGDEAGRMRWLIELALESTACGISVDSPAPEILKMGAETVRGYTPDRPLILNSLTPGAGDSLIRDAVRWGAGVVVMPIGQSYPRAAEERVRQAGRMLERLLAAGMPKEAVYLDAMTESAAMGEGTARTTLETIRAFRRMFFDSHVLCGLSNISFGMPGRSALGAAFAAMAVAEGLDAMIANLLDEQVIHVVMAAEALCGDEEACMRYLDRMRFCP